MTKPLTHLEAFCSPDAKRGRVWTDGEDEYKRDDDRLYQKYSRGSPSNFWWEGTNRQVAAMEGECHWADEPKTLTPQDDLIVSVEDECKNRLSVESFCGGLAVHFEDSDGKPVASRYLSPYIARMFTDALLEWTSASEPDPSQPADYVHAGEPITKVRDDMRDDNCGPIGPRHSHTEVPQQGIPASSRDQLHEEADAAGKRLADARKRAGWIEPPTKPPLKVGDRVKRGPDWNSSFSDYDGAGTVTKKSEHGWVDVVWDGEGRSHPYKYGSDGIYRVEKIEAEPQVEYPLSTHEAHEAYKMGIKVACEIGGTGDPRNMLYEGYRWRIVGEGKCRCARHDRVTCGATQTEGK